MTKIRSINSSQLYIAQNAEVSLKLAGNTAQVTFTAGKNKKCPIKNLSKDEFINLSTGEVKKRQHSENRFQSPKSVRKSINSLMDVIRCNATNPANCKWITLTYREEMTDCKRVFKDNKAFLRKLRSYLKKQKLPESKTDFKFIAVAEPQGENHGNAWHIHLLLIFTSKAPYISNQDISDLWGYGMTDTHMVYDVDTLALYFRAYLSDVEFVYTIMNQRVRLVNQLHEQLHRAFPYYKDFFQDISRPTALHIKITVAKILNMKYTIMETDYRMRN
ncbi:MAG: hypothetical protein IJ053_04990, partial [Lachnospiraceae bacterium]|nr:hypothetical protein [Lachnospiraceae bacterium]